MLGDLLRQLRERARRVSPWPRHRTIRRRNEVLAAVTTYYLESGDFNGTPLGMLRSDFGSDSIAVVRELILESLVSLETGTRHPNPHIKAFAETEVDDQVAELDALVGSEGGACVYPSPRHLATRVPVELHRDEPFTRELALGAGQLEFRCFEMSVLEPYCNDPRYHFDTNDISGSILLTNAAYEDPAVPERDKITLQDFGLAYDDEGRRYVAVFLRYLADLSPEHQQIWAARIHQGQFRLHRDFWLMSMGHWPEGISIFDATLEEIAFCNTLCRAIGWPAFFRTTARPRELGYLYRPTTRAFQDFTQTLDKLLSDNLEVKAMEEAGAVRFDQDGAPLGSLNVLVNFLTGVARIDPEAAADAVAPLREVRRLRQRPAHALDENTIDSKLLELQIELMGRVYGAVHSLRSVLASHPAAKSVPTPTSLTGKIWL